jgi:hypothetical protein
VDRRHFGEFFDRGHSYHPKVKKTSNLYFKGKASFLLKKAVAAAYSIRKANYLPLR